jgi:hypothetical protein
MENYTQRSSLHTGPNIVDGVKSDVHLGGETRNTFKILVRKPLENETTCDGKITLK